MSNCIITGKGMDRGKGKGKGKGMRRSIIRRGVDSGAEV